ncbi:hypothetical protein GCM10023186_36510 [Hymenobacter koreensis]|uniref:Uncharacterized protein n=1 Tax=Hymenobacter koreensis TaxID=1084523 RepID=A0ABP8JDX3_9BACT
MCRVSVAVAAWVRAREKKWVSIEKGNWWKQGAYLPEKQVWSLGRFGRGNGAAGTGKQVAQGGALGCGIRTHAGAPLLA